MQQQRKWDIFIVREMEEQEYWQGGVAAAKMEESKCWLRKWCYNDGRVYKWSYNCENGAIMVEEEKNIRGMLVNGTSLQQDNAIGS